MSETSSPIVGTPPTASAANPPVSAAVRPFGERAAWLVRWTTKGGLAVLDQALFAGSHFLLNILLARWLPPAEYGAFALAHSVFLLVAAVHGALLLEPMAVFGSGKYLAMRRSYLGILLRGHWALVVPAGIILVGAAAVAGWFGSPVVSRPLYALGAVLPLLLLTWITRRAFYLELQPGWAVIGGAVYFAALLGGAAWLFQTGRLAPVTAILAMGAAALLAAVIQLARLRPRWSAPRGEISAATVRRDHWEYGRWALASAAALWFPLNIYYLVLPAWFGLEAAGALKALMNLVNPVLHTLMAMGLLLVPVLVRHRDRGGLALMRQTIRRLLGLFLLGAAAYAVLLWLFRLELLHLLYGGKYLEYSAAPILLAGLVPLLACATIVLGSALRALELPDRLFWCYAASGGVALLAGIPLTAAIGLTGALAGVLLSYVTAAAAMAAFVTRGKQPYKETNIHG